MSSSPDLAETSDKKCRKPTLVRIFVFSFVAVLILVVLVVAVILIVYFSVRTPESSRGASGTFSSAAVAADAGVCSTAGVEMLNKGGSAVDAAIAAHLCIGVANLHSAGIGGGGFMVIHIASSDETFALDFREVAPGSASVNMYNGTAEDAQKRGGLAIAVPGAIRGFELAWQRFGRLEWHELFEPAVRVATDGVPISGAVAVAISAVAQSSILSGLYPGLTELLAPEGSLLVEGEILKRPLLAQTLKDIGEKGASYFYDSNFTRDMVSELQEVGSIISIDDFKNYTVVEREVTRSRYRGHNVFGISAPGGGPVLGLMLNILDEYDSIEDNGLSVHRSVEAMKFAYAQRLKLGDPAFNDSVNKVVELMLNKSVSSAMFERIDDSMTFDPDYYIDPFNTPLSAAHDQGTSHLSVLAENGDAVSVTNTINYFFGSRVRSQTSGIIFNNEMADFSIPDRTGDFDATEVNYIQPGKRPLSSMTPTIITDNEGVKMVVGASGGSRITTSVLQVILNVLGMSIPLGEAIPPPRFHHQLIPNQVSVEDGYPEDLRQSLISKGHTVVTSGTFAVVQGIHVGDDGRIHATSDPRKGGIPDGY